MSFAPLTSLAARLAGSSPPAAQTGRWGIFDAEGREAAVFDAFITLSVKGEAKVTSNPVEQGSFASYNKTTAPTRLQVTMARTGRAAIRAAILTRLEELKSGTEQISVITPDRVLEGYSLTSVDYSYQAADGVDRLVVALTLEEVREVAAEYSDQQLPRASVKNAGDASTVDAGKQQARKPGPSTLTRMRRAIGGGDAA